MVDPGHRLDEAIKQTHIVAEEADLSPHLRNQLMEAWDILNGVSETMEWKSDRE